MCVYMATFNRATINNAKITKLAIIFKKYNANKKAKKVK